MERAYLGSYCPTKTECFDILKEYGTPENVQRHCNAVGETAKAIATALNKRGLRLNVPLVEASGYLHDVARVHSKHDKVGADYLLSLGLEDVSEITKCHTKHRINPDMSQLNETDVLCISDRVVLESTYVGAKKRMEYIKSKAILKFGKENEDKLDKVIEDFIAFVDELESFIGEKIYDIIPDEIR